MAFHPIFVNQYQGLNEDENPHALGDSDLTIARNVWRRGRTTGTRPGTKFESNVYTTAIDSDPEVVGLADFRRKRNANRNLVAVVPGKVHLAPSTEIEQDVVAVPVITNATKEVVVTTQHRDILFGAGGDVDNTDLPWYWDADDTLGGGAKILLLAMVNLASTQIRPRWIYHWSNYLFAGSWGKPSIYDNSAGPGIIRYSALNQGTVWPVQNTFGGFSAVGGFSAAGDEFITGCNSYKGNEGEWLLILTNRQIYPMIQDPNPLIQFRRAPDTIANGCVGHAAFVSLGVDSGDAVYLSDRGIHSLRQSQAHGGREDAFLSFKIRTTFDSLNRSALDQAVGAYDRSRGLVIFAVPTGSSTKNNLILALDVRDLASGSALVPAQDLTAENARWYIWNLGDDTSHAASVLLAGQDTSLNWKIFGGNYKGQVFEFTENVFSDMGAAYTAEFQTKHYTLGSPFSKKLVGDILVDLQPGGNQQPQMKTVFDFGRKTSSGVGLTMTKSSSTWSPSSAGNGIWGQSKFSEGNVNVQNLVYGEGSGDSVAWNFLHSGTNEPFYVSQLAVQIEEMGPSTDG